MARKRISPASEEIPASAPWVSTAAALAAPGGASASAPLAEHIAPPHPLLIELVRLLAWQAARAEIAAQREQQVED